MDCGDCAASIEHLLARLPGVVAVSVSYASERIRIEYDTTVTNHDEVVQRVHWMGYKIEEEVRKTWVAHNFELLMALLCGALLLAGLLCHLLPGWPARLPVAFYLLSYFAGGYHAAHHALKAALKFRFDVDSLMVIAALGAAALGEWPEGALLLFLFSLGHALEHYAMNRAQRAIEALGQITPQTSRVRRDGEEVEVSVERLQRNDMVIVRPGERLPIDGVIVQGRSAIDQSTLTGESVPVEKGVGDEVLAGTLNGAAALEVRVTKLAADTMLARVIQLVAEAQTQKSPTQRFAERFERVFVPVVLLCVVAVIVVPPVAGWLSWSDAFLRAMTMLVAASPCALAIATPSAILAGIAQAARHGVLIKGGVHLEVLGTIDAMAFDKTGTLTCGVPEVTDVVVWEATRDELLALAAAAESRSEHPLARAVVTAAQREGLTLAEVQDVTSIVGLGVAARVGGQVVRVGAVDLFHLSEGTPLPAEKMAAVEQLQREGKTIVLVERGSHLLGLIGLADRPRPDAQPTMQALTRLGIRSLVMLTGDHERVAEVMAAEVGIGQYRAGLMPEDKVAAIRQLREEYGEVAMVGDGVNDAPALATASVGIAMGASGSDVALETADVALMSDDLSRLPFTVALSRQTRAHHSPESRDCPGRDPGLDSRFRVGTYRNRRGHRVSRRKHLTGGGQCPATAAV